MKIQIINGPNLNLLGTREPAVYGSRSFAEILEKLRKQYSQLDIHYFQSNSEGAIVDKLQEVGFSFEGVVLNAGAYTHTSLAIGDAIAAFSPPVVEVNISPLQSREEFRHHSSLAKNSKDRKRV